MNPEVSNNDVTMSSSAPEQPTSALSVNPGMPTAKESFGSGMQTMRDVVKDTVVGNQQESYPADTHSETVQAQGQAYGESVAQAVNVYGEQNYSATQQRINTAAEEAKVAPQMQGLQERTNIQQRSDTTQTKISNIAEGLVSAIQKGEAFVNTGIESIATMQKNISQMNENKKLERIEKIKNAGDFVNEKIKSFRSWDARVSAKVLSTGAKGKAYITEVAGGIAGAPVVAAEVTAAAAVVTAVTAAEVTKSVARKGRELLNRAYNRSVEITKAGVKRTKEAYDKTIAFKDARVEEVKTSQRIIATGYRSAYLTQSTIVGLANMKSRVAESIMGESNIGLTQELKEKLSKDKDEKKEIRKVRKASLAKLRQAIVAQAQSGSVNRVAM